MVNNGIYVFSLYHCNKYYGGTSKKEKDSNLTHAKEAWIPLFKKLISKGFRYNNISLLS